MKIIQKNVAIVNVLTANEQLILDLIQEIQDPEEREKQLLKFIELTTVNEKKKTIDIRTQQMSSMQDIFKHFKTSANSIIPIEVSIQTLQNEVELLKQKVQEFANLEKKNLNL